MKRKEAQNIYWLTKEIENINNSIANLRKSTLLLEEENNYKETMENYKIKLVREKNKIEKEIEKIEDPRVRIIARRRYIDLKSWELIANEMHYDTSTIQKLLWKEFK